MIRAPEFTDICFNTLALGSKPILYTFRWQNKYYYFLNINALWLHEANRGHFSQQYLPELAFYLIDPPVHDGKDWHEEIAGLVNIHYHKILFEDNFLSKFSSHRTQEWSAACLLTGFPFILAFCPRCCLCSLHFIKRPSVVVGCSWWTISDIPNCISTFVCLISSWCLQSIRKAT